MSSAYAPEQLFAGSSRSTIQSVSLAGAEALERQSSTKQHGRGVISETYVGRTTNFTERVQKDPQQRPVTARSNESDAAVHTWQLP